jgi:gamma-glutamylcyclotransferase (GGCT)/AIG2-like uncharacterized protein YtfP
VDRHQTALRDTPGSGADRRLAVYGTLAPGLENASQLAGVVGRWFPGRVRGHLFAEGWGAALGYPGLIPDPEGPEVAVLVLESPDLPAHWSRLDAFEGPGYRRVVIRVETQDGALEASIYALADAPP